MESKEGKPRLRRGFWKPEEDLLLRKYVETHGEGNWAIVSQRSGLKRGAKSCRLRWKNYLRPNIKRGMMSEDEKDLIIRLHKLLGNRWSLIAGRLPGRTDNEVKNYWNTHLNKKRRPQAKRRIVDSKSEDNPRHVNCLESNGERILEESSGGLKDGRRCDSNRWMEEMERLLMDTNDGAGAGLGFGDGDGDGLFSNGLEEFGFCDGIGRNEGENYSLEGIQAFLI